MSESTEFQDIKEIGRLLSILGEDVYIQHQRLISDDSQNNRRSFIRTFVAYVEGITHALKTQSLKHERNHYTDAEQSLLKEQIYSLNKKGHIITQKKFLPTAENFLFAIRMFSKGKIDIDSLLISNEKGWGNFLKCLKIRNRIVHPKQNKDITINDNEISLVIKTSIWFNKLIIHSLLEIDSALTQKRKALLGDLKLIGKHGELLRELNESLDSQSNLNKLDEIRERWLNCPDPFK